MTTPSWTRIQLEKQADEKSDNGKTGLVKVDAKPPGCWTVILPFVTGPRLLRFSVHDKDDKGAGVPMKWRLNSDEECGADGSIKGGTKTGALVTSAALGALVGKVGGSTADLPDASTAAATGGSGRKLFPVGSYAVVALTSNDSGPLFLTMNDGTEGFATHSGSLWVLIEEAPL